MTQPPGQQGPYQQFPQNPYPQQQGYPQQGYNPYGQPPKKKSALPWILSGVGVLVLAGVAVLLIVLLGDDDEGSGPGGGPGGDGGGGKGTSPEATANAFATGFNNRDADAIQALLCQGDLTSIQQENENLQETIFTNVPETAKVSLDRVDSLGADKAQAHYKVSGAEQTSVPKGIPLTKSGQTWEVCFTAAEGQQGGAAATPNAVPAP